MGGWLERWDRRNQRTLKRHNVRASDENWLKDDPVGPEWAWRLSWVPVLEWIGVAVVLVAAWRRRQRVGSAGIEPATKRL